jgi:hypothetical protein
MSIIKLIQVDEVSGNIDDRKYYCDICDDELSYIGFYCKKCNNIAFPCLECVINEKYVKTQIIAYNADNSPRITCPNYPYLTKLKFEIYNNDVVFDKYKLRWFIAKCPKCKECYHSINCECNSSCNCDEIGYDVCKIVNDKDEYEGEDINDIYLFDKTDFNDGILPS